MRKIFKSTALWIALCLLVGAIALATDTSLVETEYKEYAPIPEAGEMYFISITNLASGSTLVWTNQETYPWKIDNARITYASAVNATSTLSHIVVVTTEKFLESATSTNDFGNIETNYLHTLTNTSYAYVTNPILTVTHAAAGSAAGKPTLDEYIQKGDILSWTFNNTNSRYLRITGRR